MELQTRARRLAMIITLLYSQQNLAGKLQTLNRGARHLSYGVRLSDPTQLDRALKLSEPLALSAGVNAVLAQRIEGLIVYQFELNQGYWEYYTRQDVSGLAVGLAEQRKPVEFLLDPPHSLIAGTTGSGKSETLKSVLIALIQNYSADELGLILIDPHQELEDFKNESHLIIPIATSSDDIRQALAYANKELTHRKAENIKDGKTIVIGIDEAAADEVLRSPDNLQAMTNIAAQARKYHIHLILSRPKKVPYEKRRLRA